MCPRISVICPRISDMCPRISDMCPRISVICPKISDICPSFSDKCPMMVDRWKFPALSSFSSLPAPAPMFSTGLQSRDYLEHLCGHPVEVLMYSGCFFRVDSFLLDGRIRVKIRFFLLQTFRPGSSTLMQRMKLREAAKKFGH